MIHPCITTHAWRLIGTREDLKEGNHSLLVGTAIRGCRASSGNDVPAVTRRLRVAAWRVRHRRSGERQHFSLGTRGKEHVLRLRDAIAGVGNVVTVLAKPLVCHAVRKGPVQTAAHEPNQEQRRRDRHQRTTMRVQPRAERPQLVPGAHDPRQLHVDRIDGLQLARRMRALWRRMDNSNASQTMLAHMTSNFDSVIATLMAK